MKKALVLLLIVAMLAPMCLAQPAMAADAVTEKPFYVLGWSDFDEDTYQYLDGLYTINWTTVGGSIGFGKAILGNADFDTQIAKLAETIKKEMESRPAGARYLTTFGPASLYRIAPEDAIFMDYATEQMTEVMDALLKAMSDINCPLDGIVIDVEYVGLSVYYLVDTVTSEQPNGLLSNPDLLRDIVKNPKYQTEIRPLLEEWGFIFYDAGDPVKQASYTELFSITKNAGSKYERSRNVWNTVMRIHLNNYVTEWAYEPLMKYYPEANVSDYQSQDTVTWTKMTQTTDDGTELNGGNSIVAGDTSTTSFYYNQPNNSFYENLGNYTAYNDAIMPKSAYSNLLYMVNYAKSMYEASNSKKIAPWITYYDYGDTDNNEPWKASNSPFYSELLYHLGMLDPQPFLSYTYVGDSIFKDGRANSTHYHEIQQVQNDIMVNLNAVAGYSDREPIQTAMDWNSEYILSGMYANGRNIWRITPNTDLITLGEFLVSESDPTFTIEGKTITFPGGKIIADAAEVSIVGTSGYWIETDADVMPVVTTEADRYEFYPSMLYDFEDYDSGTFDYNTSQPVNAWGFTWSNSGDVKGQSYILNIDSNKKLAIIGNSKNWIKNLPTNITAGDTFAEDQTWEITVTVPEDLSPDAQIDILTYTGKKQELVDGAFMIKNYKLYYATGKYDAEDNPIYEELMEVEGGTTYGFRRVMNFHHEDAFYCDYIVTSGSGRTLKKVEQVLCPGFDYITQIGFAVTGADKAVYFDDFKIYLTGVTADFSIYDKRSGEDAELGALRDRATAYRLSWLNATYDDHTATIKADITENGKTETVTLEEVTLMPGNDGVVTGYVDVKEGQTVKVYMETTVETPVNPFAAPEEAGPLVDSVFTEGSVQEIPEALKEAGLDTAEKILAALEGKLLESNPELEVFVHYTVQIDVSEIPKHGKMTVIVPYPAGTDANYTFAAAQLYVTDDYYKELGSVEIIEVVNTSEGIQFEVYGTSPVTVSWIAPEEVEVDDGRIPMPPTDSKPTPTAVRVQRPTQAPAIVETQVPTEAPTEAPTEETEYIEPTEETEYVEPTEETEYVEPTEETEYIEPTEETEAPTETTAPVVVEEESGVSIWLIVAIAVVVLAGAGAAVFFLLKKKSAAPAAEEEIEDIEPTEETTEE